LVSDKEDTEKTNAVTSKVTAPNQDAREAGTITISADMENPTKENTALRE
jgi:hypothetical protein